jgi:hypothetical protein
VISRFLSLSLSRSLSVADVVVLPEGRETHYSCMVREFVGVCMSIKRPPPIPHETQANNE